MIKKYSRLKNKIKNMNILLVEPEFPIPPKSKNHKDFLPLPLLKIACFQKSIGNKVFIARGNLSKEELEIEMGFKKPDWIGITSLFTYWSKYVKDSVQHYKKLFPKTKVVVGGIYATLMSEHCKEYTGCDEVVKRIIHEVEEFTSYNKLDYNLLANPHPLDYQIIHASRGCFRKCKFCGTWKIEPELIFKKSIKNEICNNKLIFYDNNFLANPHIEELLEELANLKYNGKHIVCECQSGFDGRILLKKPHLAKLLKKARFQNIRIAWDWSYSQYKQIKKQIDILVSAGYKSKDLYVFMLYNWEIPFKEMEKKRLKCWEWKVQIADCRFRPLNQTFDNYNSRKKQTSEDYYIHPKWTDAEVKQFRKNVRRQNICVRMGFSFYSKVLEQKRFEKTRAKKIRENSLKKARKLLSDIWIPNKTNTSTNLNTSIS
jgi:hypothetical protein